MLSANLRWTKLTDICCSLFLSSDLTNGGDPWPLPPALKQYKTRTRQKMTHTKKNSKRDFIIQLGVLLVSSRAAYLLHEECVACEKNNVLVSSNGGPQFPSTGPPSSERTTSWRGAPAHCCGIMECLGVIFPKVILCSFPIVLSDYSTTWYTQSKRKAVSSWSEWAFFKNNDVKMIN